MPPLASVGVLIKFIVVRWLTDILDSFFTMMTVPPVTCHVQTALVTMLERVIKGIIRVRCLKVQARKSSCKKEMFNWIYYAAALPRWKLVYGDRVGVVSWSLYGRLNSTTRICGV